MTKRESEISHGDLPAKAVIFELQTYIDSLEKNAALYEERNFVKRAGVIDFIGFQVVDQIDDLLIKTAQPDKLILLKNRAEKLKSELEEIDLNLFQRIRVNIQKEAYTGAAFKNMIKEFFDLNSGDDECEEEPGYDSLDIFINGLFPFQIMPHQTKDLEPEMIYYQKTPARIVFELVEKAQILKEDVFFDLGAGLGQLTILVNLLTGIKANGVEYEPAFCAHARDCARELNLSNVVFIHADARKADYSEGTIFFMFTPFKGKILQDVLELLRKESLLRKIKVITYGPCTTEVALQSWLHGSGPMDDNMYNLTVFNSSTIQAAL